MVMVISVGERSNLKKIPSHRQHDADAQQREVRVLSMYPRRPKAEALSNTVVVVCCSCLRIKTTSIFRQV